MEVALFIFLALILFTFGILIKFFKKYGLISGFNLEELDENEKEALGNYVGWVCFVLSFIFVLAGFLSYFKYTIALLFTFGAMIVVIISIMLRSLKFYKVKEGDNSGKRQAVIFTVITMVLVMSVVSGLLVYGSMESPIEVTSDAVTIGGMYGMDINMKEISDLKIEGAMPPVLKKKNGFDLGNILKGDFILEELGTARLFVRSPEGPFIFIKTDNNGLVVLNFKDKQKTRDLYSELLNHWKRQ